jgi:hydroxypyruvate isomerase
MSNQRDGVGGAVSRRNVIAAAGSIAAAAILGGSSSVRAAEEGASIVRNGRINQAVSQWCFGKLSLDELCQHCKRIGITGIDLLNPDAFPTVKKHGLICTLTNSYGINPGMNRKENHAKCIASVRKAIDATAEYGFPNVIVMSGNRAGLDDETGAKNCIEGFKKIVGYAEQKKVTLILELLNSKRDHKDYQCDHTAWGAEVCKAVGSERLKLLYDIYHMQIQEGDVIATIRQYHQYIGHYHTGGVPGRNEIDETQELYYPAIMKAILDTGYKGYVAHEFIPKRDPIPSLEQAVKLCDI